MAPLTRNRARHEDGVPTDLAVEYCRHSAAAGHDAGGRITLRFRHLGRVSHVSLHSGGQAPVGPSASRRKTRVYDGERFEAAWQEAALNAPDNTTFSGGGAESYVDCPALAG
jgi:N-ethylmaleimide reductase